MSLHAYGHGPSWRHEQETRKIINDPLSVIYNEGQWRLSKVSPLYNLQFDAIKLKQYASKIRHAVVSAATANSSIKYSVKLEIQPHLKYAEDDPDGLLILVSATHENINKTKEVYSGILLSWGDCSALYNATHLPYMLERGEQKLGTAVKATLQTVFDCNIRQFSFTQHQLLLFAFNFLENDTSRDDEAFTLTYKTPQVDFKDKIDLSFKLEDVKLIWQSASEELTNTSELITLAHQLLQKQIFHMVTLDISVLDLREVSLPKAEVKHNGIVKMKTPEMVNCVFIVLNEISDVCITKDLNDISS